MILVILFPYYESILPGLGMPCAALGCDAQLQFTLSSWLLSMLHLCHNIVLEMSRNCWRKPPSGLMSQPKFRGSPLGSGHQIKYYIYNIWQYVYILYEHIGSIWFLETWLTNEFWVGIQQIPERSTESPSLFAPRGRRWQLHFLGVECDVWCLS